VSLADAFADIGLAFSAEMGGPYVDAEAVWPGTPVKDAGGSIITPGVPVYKPCKVQFDRATQDMRTAPDFLQTDLRILVLAATLGGPLDTTAKIKVQSGSYGGTWAILSCVRDPAGVGYVCRGRRS